MNHLFMYDEIAKEYVFVKTCNDVFLKNIMLDPIWKEHDFVYIAW